MRRVSRLAFSLAELMIALAILGIGLLFIAAALPVGISYSRDSVDFAAGSGAADEAFQWLDDLRMSRQLAKNPLIRDGAGGAAAVYPNGVGYFYPIRNDNLFRPRHIPPVRSSILSGYPYPHNADVELQNQTQPMPREGSYEHPFPDPPGSDPTKEHGDTRDDGYEPYIKIRPLTMSNISALRRGVGPGASRLPVIDDGELVIGAYVTSIGQVNLTEQPMLEADLPSFLQNNLFPGRTLALVDNPPFSPVARFFPAVTPNVPFRAEQYINVSDPAANVYRRYFSRNVPNPVNDQLNRPTGHSAAEFDRAADRRISWTVLYRRVAYDDVRGSYNGPPSPQGSGTDRYYPADRQLYEFIVIVTRKPSARHRFPRQEISDNIVAFEQPRAVFNAPNNEPRGDDRVAPMPWLVVADSSIEADHQSTNAGDPDGIMQGLERETVPNSNTGPDKFLDNSMSRPLSLGFAERSTLKFRVKLEVARLLAPGSVMIPAANDNFPHGRAAVPSPTNFATPVNRKVGFVPHMPDAAPIYEVVEVIYDTPGSALTDGATVVVKNNGAYPWVNANVQTPSARFFPFWVIPPSFVERNANNQPVFERSSPIIGIYRKVIRVPEVP